MIKTLGVPPLAGGRPRAGALRGTLPQDLTDVQVVVDCRDLQVSTESFADELVIKILRDGQAAGMSVINVDSVNATWFDASAAEWGVADRIKVDRRG